MRSAPRWQVQVHVVRPSFIELKAKLDGVPIPLTPTHAASVPGALDVLEGWFDGYPEGEYEVLVRSPFGAEIRLTASRALALLFVATGVERALTSSARPDASRASSPAPRRSPDSSEEPLDL